MLQTSIIVLMEFIETVMWVLAGFIPTLASLSVLSVLYKETSKSGYIARKLEVTL